MTSQFLKNSTHKVNELFQTALTEAVAQGVKILSPEHLLYSVLEQKENLFMRIATHCGLDEVTTKTTLLTQLHDFFQSSRERNPQPHRQGSAETPKNGLFVSPEMAHLLDRAESEKRHFGDAYVSTPILSLAFFDSRLNTRQLLLKSGFSYEESRKALSAMRGNQRILSRDDESKNSILSQFTTDLTAAARRGELDPVEARDEELDRLIQIVSRRKKNNPVLVGEPGVGKSVLVEALALRITQGKVPDYLVGKRVLSLEVGQLVAGTKMHGEFEERLNSIKNEIIQLEGQVILFVDEIHTLVGAGRTSGALDASNILKAALAKGQIQCIGATTLREYKQYIESDRALERRFQPIHVGEPTVEQAIKMVQALVPQYEKFHRVQYSPEAVIAAVTLSDRHLNSRTLPDKAVDLIDEAGAFKRKTVVSLPPEIMALEMEKQAIQEKRAQAFSAQDFEKAATLQVDLIGLESRILEAKNQWEAKIDPTSKIVSHQDICQVLSRHTGIPLGEIQQTELQSLQRLETLLKERVMGQDHAIQSVAKAIKRNRMGLKNRPGPIGSFFFVGPTGVGKTELAKALSVYLSGDEKKLIRFDMSEFMDRHTTSRLVGSPPGYVGYHEGGQLTEKIKKNPYSVVLFDEIEKAHPDCAHLFLQILDDGFLSDGEGTKVSFANTIVIFTSNLGGESILSDKGVMGLAQDRLQTSHEFAQTRVKEEMSQFFRPEFLNRLDETIVFKKFTPEVMQFIVVKELNTLGQLLKKQGFEIQYKEDVKRFLEETGFDSKFGARPLKRVIETHLLTPLSELFLSHGGPAACLASGLSNVTCHIREGTLQLGLTNAGLDPSSPQTH